MKIHTHWLAWAGFFILAGLFLLLKNLGLFGVWGEAAWAGLFLAAGLGFLVWFLLGTGQWWRAIPGFTLLSVGAMLLLVWRGIDLGDWRAAVPLFGMALGFWAALLTSRDTWWAVIPAGTLTLFAGLTGLQARLGEAFWLAVLYFGLGVVFLLAYLLRSAQRDARWAAIPAAALLLLGVVSLVNTLPIAQSLAQWWPLTLLIPGVGLLVAALSGSRPAEPVTTLPERTTPAPAARATVTEGLPASDALPPVPARPAAPAAPASDAGGDIYDLLKQQPGG